MEFRESLLLTDFSLADEMPIVWICTGSTFCTGYEEVKFREGKGVPPDLHEKIKALQREYNAHHHEVPGAANAAAGLGPR